MEKQVKCMDYNYYERQKLIESLCTKFPFIKRASIGKSCSGKEITALKIGSSSQYCLITAAFHGSERITSTILLMFIEELCNAISKNTYMCGLKMPTALSGRGVIFVPCVNPDGCDIALLGKKACGALAENHSRLCKHDFEHWNANFRGVDINHNFNADWEKLRELERNNGIYGPSPRQFGGFSPESEPETQALTKLCRTANIRQVIALHTQGEVIYWSYGEKTPKRSLKMAEIMSTASGYALDIPTGLANGGGFKDWFINEFSKPGFTIEMGIGKNPLPYTDAEKIYIKAREMLTLCTIM